MKLSNDSDEAIIYTKPEDEIFHRVVILVLRLSMHARKTHKIYYVLFFSSFNLVYLIGVLFQLSQWSFNFPLHTQQPTHEVSSFVNLT